MAYFNTGAVTGLSYAPVIGASFGGWKNKPERVMFDMLSNARNMTVLFKINIKRCLEYIGSDIKEDPTGAVATIRTRISPSNTQPDTSIKEATGATFFI